MSSFHSTRLCGHLVSSEPCTHLRLSQAKKHLSGTNCVPGTVLLSPGPKRKGQVSAQESSQSDGQATCREPGRLEIQDFLRGPWLTPPLGVSSGRPHDTLLCFQVSKCSEEIKQYIEARCGEDPLVKGIPEDKNPYKEKTGCTIS